VDDVEQFAECLVVIGAAVSRVRSYRSGLSISADGSPAFGLCVPSPPAGKSFIKK
jgi:hypothetical protein